VFGNRPDRSIVRVVKLSVFSAAFDSVAVVTFQFARCVAPFVVAPLWGFQQAACNQGRCKWATPRGAAQQRGAQRCRNECSVFEERQPILTLPFHTNIRRLAWLAFSIRNSASSRMWTRPLLPNYTHKWTTARRWHRTGDIPDAECKRGE